jgi:uncharacterized membrane protein YdjX (TVP38/TMEM64 family)
VSARLIGLAGVAIVGFITAMLLLPHSPADVAELLLGLGPAAPAIVLAAWLVLTPVLFPGTVLAAAGGLAFGVLDGAALAVVGAVGGGLVAFALGRSTARTPIERWLRARPRLLRVHGLLDRRGFAAVLAARLMPGIPASGLHYAAGVSPVSARSFAGAMAIGALLRTVPYAVLGQGIGSGSTVTLLVAGGSIALSAVGAAVLARQLRRPATAA